jgi:hypothetical protein
VYPLQFALLVPFIRVGEWILAAPPVRLTVGEIVGLIRADVWNAVATLWTATIHALMAWFMLGSLASLVIYALLTPFLRRLSQSLQAGSH